MNEYDPYGEAKIFICQNNVEEKINAIVDCPDAVNVILELMTEAFVNGCRYAVIHCE